MELKEQLKVLEQYSACDIADALLKLYPGQPVRFIHDVAPIDDYVDKLIAPVSTFLFGNKGDQPPPLSESDSQVIPGNTHWVDCTEPGTVVLLSQPESQTCAVLGGIMAARMSAIGVEAVIVHGKVRDIGELKYNGPPIWARGRSIMGAGAQAKVLARQVTIRIHDFEVSPGDIAFCDPEEGVVIFSKECLTGLLDLMPGLVDADARVMKDVMAGSTVHDAFLKHRKTGK